MNLFIRKMEISDLEFFNRVRNECVQYLHDRNKYSLDETISWFKTKKPEYFILENNNEKIGYFRTTEENGEYFIGLDIDEKFRGKKLAVPAYEIFIKNINRKEIFLYVDEKNIRAYNLYIKLGFKKMKKTKINGIPSIKMHYKAMKKIILTGSNGFVGHHVLDHILRNTDWHVYCIDKLSYSSSGLKRLKEISALTNPRVTFFSFDLSQELSQGLIEEISDANYVLHIAAESHVDNSIEDPKSFIKNNVDSTINILEFCRNNCTNLEKFLYFSTDEVFGNAQEGFSYKEGDRHNCGNPYSASKSASESICESYCNTYNLPIIITNTMNIIGERQHQEKFIPKVIKSIRDNEKIFIHSYPNSSKPGSRFYIHARNVADAFIFILNNSKERLDSKDASLGRYNIVGVKEASNLEVVEIISNIMNKKADYELIDFHSSRPGHDLRYALNGDKLSKLGWTPPINLEESIKKTVNWTLKNTQWL
jgi:dTDP-glucose 4,6-dehydratase